MKTIFSPVPVKAIFDGTASRTRNGKQETLVLEHLSLVTGSFGEWLSWLLARQRIGWRVFRWNRDSYLGFWKSVGSLLLGAAPYRFLWSLCTTPAHAVTGVTNVGLGLTTALLAASSHKYVAWGTGAGTAAKEDTTLFTESADESRTSGTQTQQTTTTTDDTYQVIGLITCATNPKTITNAGIFSAATSGSLYLKGNFTGIALSVSDSINFTCKAVHSCTFA